MPLCHSNLESGNKGFKDCPLEDFVILLIWFIRHDQSNWWPRACQAFTSLKINIGEEDFAMWLAQVDSNDSFYNGLELVLWFYMGRQKNN